MGSWNHTCALTNLPVFYDKNVSQKMKKEFVYQHAVCTWLGYFMAGARRSWIAPSGSGSQNPETIAQRTIANITLNLADWIDKRWDD